MKLLTALFFTCICSHGTSQIDQNLFIRNINYIDVNDGTTHTGQNILIEDGKILQIGDQQLSNTNGVKELDATGLWMTPGLIDAHIHLFQSGGLYTRPDAMDLGDIKPYPEERAWLFDHADDILRSYLRLGITSVIDVGGPMTNYKIREQYKEDALLPDYHCTGPLVSTYQPAAFDIEDPPIIKVTTEAEARKIVLDQLPSRPDFIKIWYIELPGMPASDNYQLVKATIEESHRHNLKVAVHATQLTTAKLAIKAGADILVHSVAQAIDQEFIDMMLASEAVLIPTLVVHGGYDRAFSNQVGIDAYDQKYSIPYAIGTLLDVVHIDHPELKEAQAYAQPMLARNNRSDKIRKTNLRKLVDAGVTIATGTDAGNIGTLHATSYKDELQAMSQADLSNHEIIKASTLGASHVLDMQEHIGSIEVGKHANLILLNSNPLDDLSALYNPHLIIKEGAMIDPDTLVDHSAEDLVQMQLNAYNLGDIESFLEPYSDTVKVYNFPDALMYQGKDRMRSGYAGFFESTPDLHCQLINRVVLGNTVVDHELVTGLNGNQEIKAVAIYKIRDGKIQEVYFDSGQ